MPAWHEWTHWWSMTYSTIYNMTHRGRGCPDQGCSSVTWENDFFWNIERESREGLLRVPRNWLFFFILGEDVAHGIWFWLKDNTAWQAVNKRFITNRWYKVVVVFFFNSDRRSKYKRALVQKNIDWIWQYFTVQGSWQHISIFGILESSITQPHPGPDPS